MKPQSDIRYEYIERLLLSKPWDALSEKEKKAMQSFFDSKSGYETARKQLPRLRKAVAEDQPGMEPDPAIRLRLVNAMQLKPKQTRVAKSSFADFFLHLFSPQHIGMKAAMATVVIAFSLWFGNHSATSVDAPGSDTARQYTDTSFNAWKDTSYVKTVLFIH